MQYLHTSSFCPANNYLQVQVLDSHQAQEQQCLSSHEETLVSQQNQSTLIDAIDSHKVDSKLLLKQRTALMLSGLFPSSFKKADSTVA